MLDTLLLLLACLTLWSGGRRRGLVLQELRVFRAEISAVVAVVRREGCTVTDCGGEVGVQRQDVNCVACTLCRVGSGGGCPIRLAPFRASVRIRWPGPSVEVPLGRADAV